MRQVDYREGFLAREVATVTILVTDQGSKTDRTEVPRIPAHYVVTGTTRQVKVVQTSVPTVDKSTKRLLCMEHAHNARVRKRIRSITLRHFAPSEKEALWNMRDIDNQPLSVRSQRRQANQIMPQTTRSLTEI